MTAKPCKYCHGKGWYSRAYQIHGSDDFGGEGFTTGVKIEHRPCQCQQQPEAEAHD